MIGSGGVKGDYACVDGEWVCIGEENTNWPRGDYSQPISFSRRGAIIIIMKPNEEINTTWRNGLIRGARSDEGKGSRARLG